MKYTCDGLIDGPWKNTKDDQKFLSLLGDNWGIAFFITRQALRCLGQYRDLYQDGTRKSVFVHINRFYLITNNQFAPLRFFSEFEVAAETEF